MKRVHGNSVCIVRKSSTMYTLNLLLNCLNSIVLVWNSGIAILQQALGCCQNEIERGEHFRKILSTSKTVNLGPIVVPLLSLIWLPGIDWSNHYPLSLILFALLVGPIDQELWVCGKGDLEWSRKRPHPSRRLYITVEGMVPTPSFPWTRGAALILINYKILIWPTLITYLPYLMQYPMELLT